MYYTTYSSTNNITETWYFGVHKTTDLYDDYLGSGLYFKNSVRKYGKENFSKLINGVWRTEEISYLMEELIVDEDMVNSDSNYNQVTGGNYNINRKYSDESKLKMRNAKLGKIQTTEHNKAISDGLKNSKVQSNGMTAVENGRIQGVKTAKNTITDNGKTIEQNSQTKRKKTYLENGVGKGFKNPMSKKFKLTVDGEDSIISASELKVFIENRLKGETKVRVKLRSIMRILNTSAYSYKNFHIKRV